MEFFFVFFSNFIISFEQSSARISNSFYSLENPNAQDFLKLMMGVRKTRGKHYYSKELSPILGIQRPKGILNQLKQMIENKNRYLRLFEVKAPLALRVYQK